MIRKSLPYQNIARRAVSPLYAQIKKYIDNQYDDKLIELISDNEGYEILFSFKRTISIDVEGECYTYLSPLSDRVIAALDLAEIVEK